MKTGARSHHLSFSLHYFVPVCIIQYRKSHCATSLNLNAEEKMSLARLLKREFLWCSEPLEVNLVATHKEKCFNKTVILFVHIWTKVNKSKTLLRSQITCIDNSNTYQYKMPVINISSRSRKPSINDSMHFAPNWCFFWSTAEKLITFSQMYAYNNTFHVHVLSFCTCNVFLYSYI